MAVYTYVYQAKDNKWPQGKETPMDDDLPIPFGWVRKDLLASIPAVIPTQPPPMAPPWAPSPAPFPSAVKVSKVGSGKPQLKRRLTAAGEAAKSEWDRYYASSGCSCHISPPCSSCTHPGNPDNIEEIAEYWEIEPEKTRADAIMDAIREMAGKGNT